MHVLYHVNASSYNKAQTFLFRKQTHTDDGEVIAYVSMEHNMDVRIRL